MHIFILTISDSCSKNKNLDESGSELKNLITNSKNLCTSIITNDIVEDDKQAIQKQLLFHYKKNDVILTTGGTGFSTRDVTPEATKGVITKECPGLVTALLLKSLQKTPFAALSRLTAGIAEKCLIINLPGSPKAVKDCFEVLEPILKHAIEVINDVPLIHKS